MEYVVFYATVNTSEDAASDMWTGHRLAPRPERSAYFLSRGRDREKASKVLLELCADDRIDLLADMMRNFPENGLNIDRVEISTARNVFYVPNTVGILADREIIVSVRENICLGNLKITEFPSSCGRKVEKEGPRMLMSLGSMVGKSLDY
ncbi:ACT domain repeat 7 [Striga asiatica]|uniref:ACT domain repeat 7 n=1 Tax=Striga asiatica TaxID=4170 RepID=A0A5A7PPU8_STRAF|nr:ACT domain repeat 7 [Striga asiatica]